MNNITNSLQKFFLSLLDPGIFSLSLGKIILVCHWQLANQCQQINNMLLLNILIPLSSQGIIKGTPEGIHVLLQAHLLDVRTTDLSLDHN